jgi:hypothetical protein
MRPLAIGLLAATLGCATAAQAQTAAAALTTADARCLLGMVALTNSKDANAQRLGQGGVIYFAGRIAARDPGYDFARLKALAATMDAKTAQTDLQQHCGPMFNKSMQQVTTALAPPAAAAGAPPPAPPAPPAKH